MSGPANSVRHCLAVADPDGVKGDASPSANISSPSLNGGHGKLKISQLMSVKKQNLCPGILYFFKPQNAQKCA